MPRHTLVLVAFLVVLTNVGSIQKETSKGLITGVVAARKSLPQLVPDPKVSDKTANKDKTLTKRATRENMLTIIFASVAIGVAVLAMIVYCVCSKKSSRQADETASRRNTMAAAAMRNNDDSEMLGAIYWE